MKKLCIYLSVFLFALLTVQAQESEQQAPRILGFDCSGGMKGTMFVSNGVTSLDVSGCTALTYLDCGSNNLKSLDVSGCTALTYLDCGSNNLKSLDVSGCTALTYLDCGNSVYDEAAGVFSIRGSNSIQSLDVSACTSLRYLDCALIDLDSIDVSGCTVLEDLDCRSNRLGALDVSKNTSLKTLYCGNITKNVWDGSVFGSNHLSSLDVSKNTALEDLYCNHNQLTGLDVSKNTALEDLNCNHNQLTGLDVSKNTALEYLNCDHNQLTGLDVSKNTALRHLDGSYNRIPLSGLYETCRGNPSNDVEYSLEGQSDSIVLLVGEAFDLSSERRFENEFSTYKIKSVTGNLLPSYLYEVQGFVFRFSEEYTYLLEIQNPAVSALYYGDEDEYKYEDEDGLTFTWYITVLESQEGYLTVQVAPNNTAWGTVSVTGNGRFTKGETATVTATPNAGYRFVNWTKKDGSVFATEAAHTFTVTENLELTANFEQIVGNEDHAEDKLYVYVKDHTIYLSEERGNVRVYNAAGVCVYSGQSTAIPVHSGGLYIVRVGEHAYKAVVR